MIIVLPFYIIMPDTKGLPLEELATLFGDDDDIAVFSADIHLDSNAHTLVVQKMNAGVDGEVKVAIAEPITVEFEDFYNVSKA